MALRSGKPVSLETLGAERDRHLELGHGRHGTADGWYTAYTYRRDDGVTILAFSNLGGIFLGDLEARLFFAAIGWPPRRVTPGASTLARYPGVYSRWDSYYKRRASLTVENEPDGLLHIRWDRFPPRLHGLRIRPHEALIAPFSDTDFFELRGVNGSSVEVGTTYRFDPGEGPAEAVVIENKAGLPATRYLRRH
jgi:hypothetical protein